MSDGTDELAWQHLTSLRSIQRATEIIVAPISQDGRVEQIKSQFDALVLKLKLECGYNKITVVFCI